jgi:hypothetical protein
MSQHNTFSTMLKIKPVLTTSLEIPSHVPVRFDPVFDVESLLRKPMAVHI